MGQPVVSAELVVEREGHLPGLGPCRDGAAVAGKGAHVNAWPASLTTRARDCVGIRASGGIWASR